MAAPQDPPRRLWEKKRRTKKLALWRAKKAAETAKSGGAVAEVKAAAKPATVAKKPAKAEAEKPAAAKKPAK
jgi:hypothetical protein